MSPSGIPAGMVRLAFPLAVPALVRNSPGDKVPSHGTWRFATSHAIDLVPVDPSGRSLRYTLSSLLRPEPAELFAGFGSPVLAPVSGVVVAATDSFPDHAAYRGFPSVGYALTQSRRVKRGWTELAGNHVMIEHADGVVVAVCHLQQGSVRARVGDQVEQSARIAACGNSGNSFEPHVHLQAMTTADPSRAGGLPVGFRSGLPRNGELLHPDPPFRSTK